jgi:hypothetical protein
VVNITNPDAREIGFSSEFRQAVIALSNARKAEKEATEQKKVAESLVKEILGNFSMLTIGGSPVVKVVPATTSTIDKTLLAEILDADTISSITKTTNYTKLTILDTAN